MARDDSKQQIDSALVRKLAKLLDETGLNEIEYGTADWHLRVAKGSPAHVAPPAPAAAPAAMAAGGATRAPGEDLTTHPGAVTSPMVGIVFTQADPDSPPFVQIGDEVEEGQTVLLIEAMKVFNPIKAPRAGRVTRLLVDNGSPVEYGEPLLIIE